MAFTTSVKCDCGHEFLIAENEYREFPVSTVVCKLCHRRATGGDARTGEITSWMTRKETIQQKMEVEKQLLEADMNEWYGRGNW